MGNNPVQQQAAQTQSEEITELQKKCDEYLAGWQRAKADYSNREKDIAREKTEFVKYLIISQCRNQFCLMLQGMRRQGFILLFLT